MYSKSVMAKMIAEVKVPTLVALAKESLGNIGEKPDNVASKEAIASLETIIGELRRRIPTTETEQPRTARAPRNNRRQQPQPQQPQPQGGEQNGG